MKIEKYAYTLQYYFEDENGNEFHYATAQTAPGCYNLLNTFSPTVELISAADPRETIKLNLVAIYPAPSLKYAKEDARELNNLSISYDWLPPCYKY